MRHGPELHDALRKCQSSGNKPPATAGTGNYLSAGEVHKPVARQTYSADTPQYTGPVALNNGTAVTTAKEPEQMQQPHGLQQQNVISDSGYWSPKNYNNSDYHVPTTRLTDLQRTISSARPMVPPPAPPPSTINSASNRDRLVHNSGYPAVHQPSRVSSGQMMADRDSLPPPPPAPLTMPEPQESIVDDDYSLSAAVHDSLAHSVEYDLPPPPMPPPFDDLPPEPPSPVPPAVLNSSESYLPQVDMAESPLPLPPEDDNFNMMVVPPPPPPLVEFEQITAKFDGEVGNGKYFDVDVSSLRNLFESLNNKNIIDFIFLNLVFTTYSNVCYPLFIVAQ